jgi:hypothetical protein
MVQSSKANFDLHTIAKPNDTKEGNLILTLIILDINYTLLMQK